MDTPRTDAAFVQLCSGVDRFRKGETDEIGLAICFSDGRETFRKLERELILANQRLKAVSKLIGDKVALLSTHHLKEILGPSVAQEQSNKD